jgi:hypothetical protein
LELWTVVHLVGVPTSHLRQLPAALSGINLQHGLLSRRAELVKTLEAGNGRVELHAVTGPDFGRIWDHELVAAVMKIAGNGTGDACSRPALAGPAARLAKACCPDAGSSIRFRAGYPCRRRKCCCSLTDKAAVDVRAVRGGADKRRLKRNGRYAITVSAEMLRYAALVTL